MAILSDLNNTLDKIIVTDPFGRIKCFANTFLFYWLELFPLSIGGFVSFIITMVFSAVRTALTLKWGHTSFLNRLERAYYVFHTVGMLGATFILFRASPIDFAIVWLAWLASRHFGLRSDFFFSLYTSLFFVFSFFFVISLSITAMTFFYMVPVVILLFSRPDIITNLHSSSFKPIVLRSIFVLSISLIFMWFYLDRSGRGIEAVESQPGIKYIFSFKRDAKIGKQMGEYLRFVQDDCNGRAYYFGGLEFLWFATMQPSHILRYDKSTGSISDTGWDIQSGFVPDMDCSRNLLYVGGFQPPEVRVFRPGTWEKPVRVYKAPGGDIYNVKLLFNSSTMLVWDQSKNAHNLSMIRLSDGRILARQEVKSGVSFDISADLKECVTCGENASVFALTNQSPYISLIRIIKAVNLYSCIYTTNTGHLLANDLGSPRVMVVDMHSAKISSEKLLPHGTRNMLLVRKGIVAISDYWQGHIMFIDESDLKVIGVVRTGRRVRNLYFSRDKMKVLFSDALGVGELDLDKILNGRLRAAVKLKPPI